MTLLTKLREEKGWSRSELARRAKMHASDVGRIEAGRAKPYPVQLRKLARALGFPAARAERLLENSIPRTSPA